MEKARQEPHHWQRGLSPLLCRKIQGHASNEVHQTVNTQDVENAVWHYLCVAKTDGVAEAEKHFIKITPTSAVEQIIVAIVGGQII